MTERRDKQPYVDRRGFLGTAGALAGATVLGLEARAQSTRAARVDGQARNLILAVADGLSAGAIAIADAALRERDGSASRWLSLMNDPHARTALVATAPADGPLTDSAASASSWAIGERVNYGAISHTPDGRTPAPLFLRAKQSGRKIGLVTTAPLTDATPAAMLCNAISRSDHTSIARQMIDRGLDLGIGGGARYFQRDEIANQTDRIVTTRAALEARLSRSEEPLIALLDDGFMPHALDRSAQDLTQPEAAMMALRRLANAPGGFCLLFENENTDNASHANDAASLLHDYLDFEAALEALIRFTQERDDTLLVVTTDHGCGNPGFSDSRAEGTEQLRRLLGGRRSFRWVLDTFRAMPDGERTAEALSSLLHDATGATLTETDVRFLRAAMLGDQANPYRAASRTSSVMGAVLANHLGVAFSSPHHTTDLVIATAIGPGSEALPTHCHHSDLHDVMARALGLEG